MVDWSSLKPGAKAIWIVVTVASLALLAYGFGVNL